MSKKLLSRRKMLLGLGASPLILLGCSRKSGQRRPPVPAYDARPEVAAEAVCRPTEANIEGPFFKAGAPSRAVLADAKTPGTPLVVSGRVTDGACRPLPGATLEVWHADHAGAYDNKGFELRGTMQADEAGAWRLETIVPGRYRLDRNQFRPAHVHVKVRAKGFEPLTTQLYFDGDPYNDVDPFIRESLIMDTETGKGGRVEAGFDFALRRA